MKRPCSEADKQELVYVYSFMNLFRNLSKGKEEGFGRFLFYRWGGDWNKNEVKDGFIDTPHFEMQP